MPVTSRTGIPYPAQLREPWFTEFVAALEAIDAQTYAAREDRNLIMMGGGTVSFNVSGTLGTLAWTQAIDIYSPPTGLLVSIPIGSIALLDGEAFYVDMVRSPTAPTTTAAQKASQVPSTNTAILIGLRRGVRVYFRQGDVISDGMAVDLFNEPSAVTLSGATPVQVDAGDVGTAGIASAAARGDHEHPVNTALLGGLGAQVVGAGSAGVAATLPRGDHVHPMASASAVDTRDVNAAGAATTVARSDHTHRIELTVRQSDVDIGFRPALSFVGFRIEDYAPDDQVYIFFDTPVASYFAGIPAAGATILRIPFVGTLTFPVAMAGSRGTADVASTGNVSFSIRKNGVEFATMTFNASATATFAAAMATSLLDGDILTIIAPNPADATLSGIGFALKGTRG